MLRVNGVRMVRQLGAVNERTVVSWGFTQAQAKAMLKHAGDVNK